MVCILCGLILRSAPKYPGIFGSEAAAQRARVLRRDTFTPSIIHNTKPLSFDIKPLCFDKFICGLIQKPYSFSMFLYAQYGGLVVCRIPRKCGLIKEFRFSLLTYGGLSGKMITRPYLNVLHSPYQTTILHFYSI